MRLEFDFVAPAKPALSQFVEAIAVRDRINDPMGLWLLCGNKRCGWGKEGIPKETRPKNLGRFVGMSGHHETKCPRCGAFNEFDF